MGTIGSLIGRIFLFVIAMWIGSAIGTSGLIAGELINNMTWNRDFITKIISSPLLLFSSWLLLNLPFLGFSLFYFIRNEGDSYLTWGIVIGVQSLMVMAGWAHVSVHGWLPLTCAWSAWAILLTMAGTGIWLVRQFFINQWAQNLGMLRAENAQIRAEREDEAQARIALEDDR